MDHPAGTPQRSISPFSSGYPAACAAEADGSHRSPRKARQPCDGPAGLGRATRALQRASGAARRHCHLMALGSRPLLASPRSVRPSSEYNPR